MCGIFYGCLEVAKFLLYRPAGRDGLQESGGDGVLPPGTIPGEVSSGGHLVRGCDRHWLQVGPFPCSYVHAWRADWLRAGVAAVRGSIIASLLRVQGTRSRRCV